MYEQHVYLGTEALGLYFQAGLNSRVRTEHLVLKFDYFHQVMSCSVYGPNGNVSLEGYTGESFPNQNK
jgi:hypothetical protein